MDALKVLGIDPGVRHLGITTLLRTPDGGWHYVSSPVLHGLDDLAKYLSITVLGYEYNAEPIKLVAIEEVAHILDVKTRSRSTGTNRIIECHGMARMTAKALGVPLIEVDPNKTLKLLTGSGVRRAGEQKKIVARAVEHQVHGWPSGMSEHRTDAAGICIAGYRLGVPFIR